MREKRIRHPPLYSLTDALRSVLEKHSICILPCPAITKCSNTDFYRKILTASQSFPCWKTWYSGLWVCTLSFYRKLLSLNLQVSKLRSAKCSLLISFCKLTKKWPFTLVAYLKRSLSLQCSVLQDLVLAKNTGIHRHYPIPQTTCHRRRETICQIRASSWN